VYKTRSIEDWAEYKKHDALSSGYLGEVKENRGKVFAQSLSKLTSQLGFIKS